MYDTIAAISSGLTESGIGIIRISGDDSYDIIDKIFRNKAGGHVNLSAPNRVHYGFIIDPDNVSRETSDYGFITDPDKISLEKYDCGFTTERDNVSRETLDEVLVINMRAPHSYTGEDTIEINCHGGVLMMKRILDAVIRAGARHAEPGEFTKRAFLSGRIDLSQAEAVMDLINAKNVNAIKASVSQLRGSVSAKIKEIRSGILEDCAFIEAALDDPEHYSLEGFSDRLIDSTHKRIYDIDSLIKTNRYGKIIKEGVNTVIIGKPNAGKSSLLNALLGEERAIVTTIPGTTRDTINESISAGDITLNLIDTAGIRNTDDPVEIIGVKRALDSAENADIVLFVIDASEEIDSYDLEIISKLSEMDTEVLTLFNKTDKPMAMDPQDVLNLLPEEKRRYLLISAMEEKGIENIFEYIEKLFAEGSIDVDDQTVITSLRHMELLGRAKKHLHEVIESVSNGLPEDFYSIDLMSAYGALGEICGEDMGEDLIDEIFSKFCMGK